ncbi:LTA synthase family protein [Sulfurovum riftiae]|uniref:Sulfatase n=1 Tax=Sulfurovum riftiae TaxID=1630136 RepID=A0A151CE93_9BACT|nr:LTA synthase family protein [Sulfurovum riftiae]KYJ85850.1 sulfatase [Sulfurovum riftiae]
MKQNIDRYRLLLYFVLIFLSISFISRAVLLTYTFPMVSSSITELAKVFLVGVFYDLVAYFYFIIPFTIYLFIVPTKVFNSKMHKFIALSLFFATIYAIVFNAFSEWFFWDEFGKRFNFIAVDYLVYTHEVLKNIQESYPMPLLLSIILLITILLYFIVDRTSGHFSKVFQDRSSYRDRLPITLVLLSIPFISFLALEKQTLATSVSDNRYNQELSKNGFYSLFSAFRNNELDYYEFYKTQDNDTVLETERKLTMNEHSTFVSNDLNNTLKNVHNGGKEKRYNVMLVMIESLSASYMGIYGNDQNLTPHMDALTQKSLFFSNFFATGTRTVRGMEAVTMGIPPTPGRSIVKRPDNHNLFGMGWVFKEKGYDNKFIYAGHGYFDNMNEYFSHNGFSIVDRFNFKENEVTFSNVWGVCDEDLFAKSIKEADKSFAQKKPFFSFIMTTSNHRPYTYPEGKIDIPSHTGRTGGVKYTDFSVNEFLKKASKKPWFSKTLFIFVADHNGGSAGKNELPIHRYKIPFLVYAPSIIKPEKITKLASQIDLAPTLFAILGWDYQSKFYGKNILDSDFRPRALIGNYQKLGLYRDNRLTILLPNKSIKEFEVRKLTLNDSRYAEMKPSQKDVNDTIAYYQSASYLYMHHLLGK